MKRTRGFAAALCLAAVASLVGCAQNAAREDAELVTEDFMIPAADAGYQLHVRNKRPANLSKFEDRKSTRLNSSHSQQSRMPSSA